MKSSVCGLLASSRPTGTRGLTFVEVMIAFLIMGLTLLPVYTALTSSVKETERFYTEAVAISHAKFVMDTLMFQVPFRVLREEKDKPYCRFEDPKNVPAINTLLGQLAQKMFVSGYDGPTTNAYYGNGILTDPKGFVYRVRVYCVDLDDVEFAQPSGSGSPFSSKELTTEDADGRFTLIKKIVLEVRWSGVKGRDPNKDPNFRSLHLVGFKSFLEA